MNILYVPQNLFFCFFSSHSINGETTLFSGENTMEKKTKKRRNSNISVKQSCKAWLEEYFCENDVLVLHIYFLLKLTV